MLQGYVTNINSYHRLLDLVVNGHHVGARGAEREENKMSVMRQYGAEECGARCGTGGTSPRPLPIVDPDRCALLPEHRGQKRYGEIPQLTNAKIHRHRVALGVHATPAINTPTGESSAA